MNRFFLVVLMIIGTFSSYGQVIINNEAKDNHDPNEIFINGISTRSDIGGVDIEYVTVAYNYKPCPECNIQRLNSIISIKMTNYNFFPVTVLYKYTLDSTRPGFDYPQFCYSEEKTGSIVIPPAKGDNYPSKLINNVSNNGGVPIDVRRLITITRKVGQ